MESIRHRSIESNGIKIHIAEKGSGPLVLLIHGFPELWYSWRHQILALADNGYHALAPDLRGYGDSDAPQGVENYTCFHIVGDLISLLNALGEEKARSSFPSHLFLVLLFPFLLFSLASVPLYFFHSYVNRRISCPWEQVFVVGHDWGALIAWYLCLLRPDRVKALVSLSVQFVPRNPKIKPVDSMRKAFGDDYYICRFQVSIPMPVTAAFSFLV